MRLVFLEFGIAAWGCAALADFLVLCYILSMKIRSLGKKSRFLPLFVVLCFAAASCASNKGSSFEESDDFIVDDSGSGTVPLGSLDVGLTKALSSAISKETVVAIYDGANDIVTLEYLAAGGIHNRQYWTAQARSLFIRALSQYEIAYETRNLPTGFLTAGKREAYGTTEIRIQWWSTAFSNHSRGLSRLDFGYLFKDRSPYFVVTQNEAKDTYVSTKYTSSQVTLYFTRTMAKDLAVLFDEENIYAAYSRR
jgi:hypothetical protein